ncbi:Uncharacterised protein [Bordetella pertussis]|nr:Uncharacterised protein [Bordetella pertussis]
MLLGANSKAVRSRSERIRSVSTTLPAMVASISWNCELSARNCCRSSLRAASVPSSRNLRSRVTVASSRRCAASLAFRPSSVARTSTMS